MKIYITLFILFIGSSVFSQINAGKIVFERKTNLEKKFTDGRMKKMLGEDNKIRVELFDFISDVSVSNNAMTHNIATIV